MPRRPARSFSPRASPSSTASVRFPARPAGRPLSYLQGVDEQAHASEPRHAASISPAGEVVAICTDPTRDPRPEPTWSPPELSLTAASEARLTFLCRLLSQRIAKVQVLEHVALVLVGAGAGMAWEDYELAWSLLDVGGQEMSDGGDAQEALVSYAARGPEEAARTGLALAFSISEGFVDAWSADWSRAWVHLEFLERPAVKR